MRLESKYVFPTKMEDMKDRSGEATVCAGVGWTEERWGWKEKTNRIKATPSKKRGGGER